MFSIEDLLFLLLFFLDFCCSLKPFIFKIIEGGSGYLQDTTTLSVSVPGDGSQFRALIQEWRINLFERHLKNFTGDDGFIAHEFNENSGLQFSQIMHLNIQ